MSRIPANLSIGTFTIALCGFCLVLFADFAKAQEGQFDKAINTQKLEIPMTPPEKALEMLTLPEGFKATLFAAEPDVHQPIAATIDARGRLWVVECYTYSDRKDNYNDNLFDRVLILEDIDHDGVFDKRKVFWDKGNKLTGIEVGLGGVWLTAAPNLLFIPDKNGDDQPDAEPTILLNGFEDNVIRHNIVNGLRWGPDGWLYGRHGIQGYSFVGPPDATESQRTPTNCCIWRYHPFNQTYEVVAHGGTNPWGFDFDENGEMFMINTVIGHLFHVVPNARYRRMYGSHFNPHLYGVIEQTADHFHWDVSEEHWAVTKKEGMSDGTDAAGGGHAHTGLMIYQGNQWPKEFHNKLFTANFHGRRVNSESIHRHGNSYVAHHGPDYIKSDDPWFRGIEMLYGPDGGVYLLDWSDIGECHENDGIHRTSGRIFKITHGHAAQPPAFDFANVDKKKLIQLLGNKNEFFVRQARLRLQQHSQEMRVGSRGSDYKEAVASMGAFSINITRRLLLDELEKSSSPQKRLRLIWTLYSVAPLLSRDFLIKELTHESENVRSWAVRLLTDGQLEIDKEICHAIEQMTNDESGLVRMYVAGSLPRFDAETAFRIATSLSKHSPDSNDRVQPKLVWYGIEPHLANNLNLQMNGQAAGVHLLQQSKIPLLQKNIARRLTHEIDDHPELAQAVLKYASDPKTELTAKQHVLEGMSLAVKGWSQVSAPQNWESVSAKLAELEDSKLQKSIQQLDIVFGKGRAIEELKKLVADNAADLAIRRKAIVSLGNSNEAPKLFELLKQHLNNKALTNAVTKALAKCEEPAVAKVILGRFPHMDPEGKTIAINTLVTRANWAEKLLDAVDSGRVERSFVSASHARQISNFENQSLSAKLTQVWGEVRKSSKERLIEIDRLRTKLKSNALSAVRLEQGRLHYEKNCASCHTLFGTGGKIGPDLTGSDRKNLNYLLENIVDPSASVAQSYRTSVVLLDDGRLLNGVVVRENDRTLELQTKDDLMTIDVKTIEERRLTNDSLMPEGLLDNLSDEDIADLFGFLSK